MTQECVGRRVVLELLVEWCQLRSGGECGMICIWSGSQHAIHQGWTVPAWCQLSILIDIVAMTRIIFHDGLDAWARVDSSAGCAAGPSSSYPHAARSGNKDPEDRSEEEESLYIISNRCLKCAKCGMTCSIQGPDMGNFSWSCLWHDRPLGRRQMLGICKQDVTISHGQSSESPQTSTWA